MKYEFDDGKYSLEFNEKTGELKALRFGKQWQDFSGNKLIYCMLSKVLELQQEVDSMKDEYEPSPIINVPNVDDSITIGDYVFASKWGDADPADPWCVGHVTYISEEAVRINGGSRFYRKAIKITPEQGESIVKHYNSLRHGADYKTPASIWNCETEE